MMAVELIPNADGRFASQILVTRACAAESVTDGKDLREAEPDRLAADKRRGTARRGSEDSARHIYARQHRRVP
jgi:hypothetical protein